MARLMIVDDEPSVLTVLRVLVGSMGHEAVTCLNADEALQKMILDPGFDLVLSDLRMNPMSGMELLKAVKEHWPNRPVIMVSAYMSDENREEAKRLGAFGGLPKPFSSERLQNQIDAALSGKSLEE